MTWHILLEISILKGLDKQVLNGFEDVVSELWNRTSKKILRILILDIKGIVSFTQDAQSIRLVDGNI